MGNRKVPRPTRFTVYMPDGTHGDRVGWLHTYYTPPPNEVFRLAFSSVDGAQYVLPGTVVIVNAETGGVAFNPRKPLTPPPWAGFGVGMQTPEEKEWLDKNPHWPRELELDMKETDEMGFPGWEEEGGDEDCTLDL